MAAAARVIEAFRHAGGAPDGLEDRRTVTELFRQLDASLSDSTIEVLLNAAALDDSSGRVDFFALVRSIFQDTFLCVEMMFLRQHGIQEPSMLDAAYVKERGLIDVIRGFVKGICTAKPSDVCRFGAEYFSGLGNALCVDAAPATIPELEATSGGLPIGDAVVLPGVMRAVSALPSDACSKCSSVSGAPSCRSSARRGPPPQRQVSRSWSKRSDCGNLEAGEQGSVHVHVTMAASGEDVCDVRMHRGATVAELRESIRSQHAVALVQQDLLAGGRILDNEAELLADVLHSLPDERDGVQLVIQPAEDFLDDVRKMRKQLSREVNPPIQEAIDAGVVPRYIRFLEETTWPELQFEAGWALTNIASGSSEQTRVVVHHGALPRFVAQLASPDFDVRAQAVWALANIAGDGPALRDEVLQSGVVGPMLDMLHSDEERGQRRPDQLVWALSNLCRGIPRPTSEAVAPILGRLHELLTDAHNDEELVDVCWIASYLTEGPNERGHAVVETGCVPHLVRLLGHAWSQVQTPALRALGNILTGADEDTQVVLDAEFLNLVAPMLDHTRASIRKEACWALSNITAGTRAQIQMVIESGLVARLVRALYDAGETRDVKREACFAITNAASAKGGHIGQLVELGCTEALMHIVRGREDGDFEAILPVALEAVQSILAVGTGDDGSQLSAHRDRVLEGGGYDVIEAITHDGNVHCRELACRILKHLGGESDTTAPTERDVDVARGAAELVHGGEARDPAGSVVAPDAPAPECGPQHGIPGVGTPPALGVDAAGSALEAASSEVETAAADTDIVAEPAPAEGPREPAGN